ncbi:MAG: hypothetical protein GKR93_07480 [Gammaproteobacteria bacterium]|nr:hypothetical protein [Gammaproteobacteria bacterium]
MRKFSMFNTEIYSLNLSLRLLTVLLVFIIFPAQADNESKPSARSLIRNMSMAVRQLNYEGVFIHQRGGQMNTLRLIHKFDEKGGIERLVSLTGAAREVIRDAESVRCYFPDDQAVVVEKSRPRELLSSQLPRSLEKLEANYQFSIVAEDRVAGRKAWVVNIRPNDAYRYGYQFWIDQIDHLLLKSELRNRTGLLLEQIMFTQLDILDTVSAEMLKPSISGAGYTWHNNSKDKKTDKNFASKWQVSWMPSGFSKDNEEMYPATENKTPVNHIVYSDGLAMVSVFIEKLDSDTEMTTGLSRLGGVNAYARITKGYQVTAVGEVPQATVQRMANSVSTEP